MTSEEHVRWSRELPSDPTTATVTLDPDGRYFVSFVVEVEPARLPATNKQAGIDLGLTDLVVTSSGFKSGNPRIRSRRKDFLDKLSTDLVREHDMIVVEELRVKNMLKMRTLSKATSDASRRAFVGMLEYKCEWAGRVFLKVNPAYIHQERALTAEGLQSPCRTVFELGLASAEPSTIVI